MHEIAEIIAAVKISQLREYPHLNANFVSKYHCLLEHLICTPSNIFE